MEFLVSLLQRQLHVCGTVLNDWCMPGTCMMLAALAGVYDQIFTRVCSKSARITVYQTCCWVPQLAQLCICPAFALELQATAVYQ